MTVSLNRALKSWDLDALDPRVLGSTNNAKLYMGTQSPHSICTSTLRFHVCFFQQAAHIAAPGEGSVERLP